MKCLRRISLDSHARWFAHLGACSKGLRGLARTACPGQQHQKDRIVQGSGLQFRSAAEFWRRYPDKRGCGPLQPWQVAVKPNHLPCAPAPRAGVLGIDHSQHFGDSKGVISGNASPTGDTVDNFVAVGFHQVQQASTTRICKLLNLSGLQCDVYHSTPALKADSPWRPESFVFNYLRFNDLRPAC